MKGTCLFLYLFVFHFIHLSLGQNCALPEAPRFFVDTELTEQLGDSLWVTNAGELQMALDLSEPGDVIVLDADFQFVGNFTLPEKSGDGWVHITTSKWRNLPGVNGRISEADSAYLAQVITPNVLPVFRTMDKAHHYRFIGIEMTVLEGATNQNDLVEFDVPGSLLENYPHHLIIDRCWIHGNPIGNIKNGVALNCGEAAVINSRITEIHSESGVSTFNSHGISCYEGTGPFCITNNLIQSSHINILFGGAIPAIQNLTPSDIVIRCNELSKPLKWRPGEPDFQGITWGVKNLFELKHAQRLVFEFNVLEHVWPSDPLVAGGPQHGYAILLTTRDEGGNMPWSVVQDIRVAHNLIRNANCGFSLLGTQGQGLHRVEICDNLMYNIGQPWGDNDKTGRMFQVNGASNLCIEHNTFVGDPNNLVFAYSLGVENFRFWNNITQHHYGFQGLNNYEAIQFNAFAEGGSSAGYPSNNYFPNSWTDIGFVDANNLNYELQESSLFRTASSSGGVLGCDVGGLMEELSHCNPDSTFTGIASLAPRVYKVFFTPNPAEKVIRNTLDKQWDYIRLLALSGEIVIQETTPVQPEEEWVLPENVYPGWYLLEVWDSQGTAFRAPLILN